METTLELSDRLHLFYGMIRTAYPINLWTYDGSFQLIYTDAALSEFGSDIVMLLSLKDVIRSQLNCENPKPFLLETTYGFLYLTAAEFTHDDLRRIYLFGPLYTGSASALRVQQRLLSLDLSISQRRYILSELEKIPVIPYSTLLQYAVMLHFVLTSETIQSSDIRLAGEEVPDPRSLDVYHKKKNTSHRGVWEMEQQLIRMIREGNPAYTQAMSQSLKLSSGVRADFGDPIRHAKNNLLVLLTLSTRAAIEGGVPPDIIYNLNDSYAETIEHAPSMTALMTISTQLMEELIGKVQEFRNKKGISSTIQAACHYIDAHLSDPITIHQLSFQAGYADYYFSQKFKKETGMSVSEYLAEKRIERAKVLLRDPSVTLDDVQDKIGMASRSRFYELFKEKTGMTPAEYRNRPL